MAQALSVMTAALVCWESAATLPWGQVVEVAGIMVAEGGVGKDQEEEDRVFQTTPSY